MLSSDPIGLPGLAVIALGFCAWLAAFFLLKRQTQGEAVANPTRSRQSVVGIVIQGLGFFVATFGPQRVTLDPLGAAALAQAAAVAVLFGSCIALFVASTRAMGRNWSLVARTRDDHQLVRNGPFARVRHPIYTGLFLMMIALAIAFGHSRQLLLAVPLYALGTLLRVREEERLLRAKFGRDYDVYAAEVRRFVPRLF